MTQGKFQLAGRGPGVQAHRHRTELLQSQKGKDPFDPVAHQNGGMVATAHAECRQSPGGVQDLLMQLGIAQAHAARHHGFARAMLLGLLAQQGRDGTTLWNDGAHACSRFMRSPTASAQPVPDRVHIGLA